MNVAPIPGYDSYYATEEGQVITDRSGIWRVLSSSLNKDGYLRVNIKTAPGRQNRKSVPVHSLVLLAFYGEPGFDGYQCRHLNGNKLDNRLCNLVWGTAKENYQDAVRHGTQGVGENANCSKLSAADVREIKSLVSAGGVQTEIAEQLGIHQKHVSDIKLQKTWKHLWSSQ